MKSAVFLALAILLAAPALAEEKADDAKKGGGAAGTNIDLPYLMAPLQDGDGKLIGYAYIVSRLTVVAEGDKTAVTEKMPFIQDARVRDVNVTPVAGPDDPQKVDVGAVERRTLALTRKIMGASKIKLITVCTVQIALLHPTQPANVTPADAHRDLDDHGNPQKSRCEAEKAA